MIRLTVLILVFGIFTPTLAAEPKTYTAKFNIYQDGDKVGGSTKELAMVSDNTYRLRTSSSAKIFFVKLRYREDAIFTWENDKAKPQSYLQSSDTSFSSERKTVQTFNWPTMTETGTYKDRSWDIELSDDYEYSFSSSEYGIFNPYGEKEKATGDDRGFEQELKEMIYNVGLEWWYTDNFAMRLGFIYDEEGDVKNPTFGAGIKFNNYGFDFGYTSGPSGHPRSNTMFFSLSLGL